jgi:hypothetical protein
MVIGIQFTKAGYWAMSYRKDKRRYFHTEAEAIEARLGAERLRGIPESNHLKPPSRIWPIEDGMALLEVFPNSLMIIDQDEIEKVRTGRRWLSLGLYAYSNSSKCLLHQSILGNFKCGHEQEVDHKDRNVFNNLKYNLRPATSRQNKCNARIGHNNSGYKGVCHIVRKNRMPKYRAMIRTPNGENKVLGYYEHKEDAAQAYNQAAIKYFGEFAVLNIIE